MIRTLSQRAATRSSMSRRPIARQRAARRSRCGGSGSRSRGARGGDLVLTPISEHAWSGGEPTGWPQPLYDPSAMLCHYTLAHTAFEDILPSGKLRMNAYARMRDPFEYHPHHLWVPDGIQTEEQDELWLLISGIAGSLRSRKRLLSLTQGDARSGTAEEIPFRCPWARARLWEQYADDHRGVCLVFDREAMLQAVHDGPERQRGVGGARWSTPSPGSAARRERCLGMAVLSARGPCRRRCGTSLARASARLVLPQDGGVGV